MNFSELRQNRSRENRDKSKNRFFPPPLVLGQVLRLVLVPDLAADSGCLGLLGLYSGGRGLDGSGLGPLVLGQVLRLVPLLGVDSDGLGQRGLISGLGLQRLTAGLLDRV